MQNNKNHLLMCILNYHHVQMTFISFFQPLILVYLYTTLTLIAISQISEWFTDADLTKYLVHSCAHKTEELYENSPRSGVYCFVVEWDFCLFLFTRSSKRVIGTTGSEIQLHSFLSLQWFIVTRVLSEPQHIKPRSFEMTKPVCC